MTLRRVDPISFGKIAGVVYAIFGAVAGIFVTAFSLLGAAFGMSMGQPEEAWLGLLFGVGSLILMPLFYDLIGFVMSLLMA